MIKYLLILLAALPAFAKSDKIILTKDNTLVMNDYFDPETVSRVAQKARELDAKLKSKDPLYLVLDTGGGYIDSGIELIENLNNLNRPVHTVTLFAASMGFQTVQGVKGKRYLTANGTLMSHKARGAFVGEFPGQVDSRYSYYLKRVVRLNKTAVSRSGGKHSLKSYESLIENEYWCDGEDCIAQGFADQVASPSCDSSLNGSHNKVYDRFVYMGSVVEIIDTYSNCPLITGPLSWQVYIDGQPLFEQYLTGTVSNVALTKYGLETAENIKKLVTKKMDARTGSGQKEVRKY